MISKTLCPPKLHERHYIHQKLLQGDYLKTRWNAECKNHVTSSVADAHTRHTTQTVSFALPHIFSLIFGPGVRGVPSFCAVQLCDKTGDNIWLQDQESKKRAILQGGEKNI